MFPVLWFCACLAADRTCSDFTVKAYRTERPDCIFMKLLLSRRELMKKHIVFFAIFILLGHANVVCAGYFDTIFDAFNISSENEVNANNVAAGLKEALRIGTSKAVSNLGKVNGFFDNNAVKILMPEKMQTVANLLSQVGFKNQVDAFILSMNRAAEKAVPEAVPLFVDAIKHMTISDAVKILKGGDTAATDYFRARMHGDLYKRLRPVVISRINSVGVTRTYNDMMRAYSSLPFTKQISFDLNDYVTNKTLDGLFYMVAQEEKRIRRDPAARVTHLLKTVFGSN